MLFTNILSVAAILGVVSASPVQRRTGSTGSTTITFNGAAGAYYDLTVPLDGSETFTNNDLSISTIDASIDLPSLCTLKTVDYTPALVEGPAGTWAVGPPQTVISITCGEKAPPNPQTISVQFNGANPQDGVYYTLTVPLDGSVVYTNNVLSISTIYTTYADLPKCNLVTVDYTPALVLISADTWAVGPPQTVKSIQCF